MKSKIKIIGNNNTDRTDLSPLKVMASVAFREPYLKRVAQYTQVPVLTTWLPTVEIIEHLRSNRAPDLVIIDTKSIAILVQEGKIIPQSVLPYVSSGIGIGVAKGSTHPVIDTRADLMRVLVQTKSLAYSSGPSGVYLSSLFVDMGISELLQSKTKIIQGEPVGNAVMRGEAEIGFQQIAEILGVSQIDYVGPLPREVQFITTFAFAVPSAKPAHPQIGAFTDWMSASSAMKEMTEYGLLLPNACSVNF